MTKVKQMAGNMIPGTNQVKINPVVTMVMTIITYLTTEFTSLELPPEVWVAIAGLVSYALQYAHGPRNEVQ